MTGLDTRYFLGVKANKVRFKFSGSDEGRSRSRRGSIDIEDHGDSYVDGGGESKATASFFTSFEDSDLGLECVGIGSLVDVQNQGTQVTWNASWTCPSKVTALEVNQTWQNGQNNPSSQSMNMGQGGEQGRAGSHQVDSAEIWAGTCRGEVCKIRYNQTTSVSTASVMKEDDGDDYGNDFEVVKVHEGVVSCVDVNGQSGEVLSAGYDGSVFIHSSLTFANNNNNKNMNPSSGGSGRSRLHHSTQGAVSYTCAKWCSGDVFLTGTSASHMTLQTWDRRSKEVKTSNDLSDLLLQQNNSSSSSSSYISHHSSHTILCVDVHPSRPHICCTGHEDGLIALWDLRKENKPVSFNTFRPSGSGSGGATMNNNNNHSNTHTNHHNHHRRRGLGHVWEVKFAPQEALQLFDRTSESLLSTGGGGGGDHAIFACTQDGVLGCTRQTTHTHESNKDSGMMEVLMTENSSIDSFDLDVENLCMICVTGQEGLIYVRDNFSAV